MSRPAVESLPRLRTPRRAPRPGLGSGVVDDDVRAGRSQQLRDLLAHAGAATSDNRDLPLQIHGSLHLTMTCGRCDHTRGFSMREYGAMLEDTVTRGKRVVA
jgi:hypothetical protein